MASDNHAKYGRIGFAVVAGAAAIVTTLIWLGGIGGSSEYIIESYYDDAVTGLAVGSPVNYRGVKIGRVRRISFIGLVYPESNASESGKIYLELAIDRESLGCGDQDADEVVRAQVQRGLRATVSMSGITGMARVELNFPKGEVPPPQYSWRPDHVLVPPSPSLLDNFSDAVTKFLVSFNKMNSAEAMSNIASIASSSARITANVDAIVEGERGNFTKIVQNLAETSDSLREVTSDIRANPSLLLRSGDPDPLPETAR